MSQATATGHPATPRRHRVKRQAGRYLLFSLVSFVTNLGLVFTLHEWASVPAWSAVVVAMAVVTVMNFVFMRRYVFDGWGEPWPGQFVRFVVSIAGFRLAEYAAFVLLAGLAGLAYLPVYASILVASFVAKFVYFRARVFVSRSARQGQVAAAG